MLDVVLVELVDDVVTDDAVDVELELVLRLVDVELVDVRCPLLLSEVLVLDVDNEVELEEVLRLLSLVLAEVVDVEDVLDDEDVDVEVEDVVSDELDVVLVELVVSDVDDDVLSVVLVELVGDDDVDDVCEVEELDVLDDVVSVRLLLVEVLVVASCEVEDDDEL